MPTLLRQYSRWIIVVLAGFFMLLPFISRPVFVDDHAHFAEAMGLARQGGDLYTSSYSMGWQPGAAPNEANPPGYFYLMAGWIRLFGTEIWKAHVLIMSFSLAGLLGFYAICRRYTAYPEWAALLWMSSPHYWLTSNSLLLDALLGPSMVLGLAFWIYAWKRSNGNLYGASVLFLSLAPLVKYTGLLIWPVVVLWTLLEGRRLRRLDWCWLAVPPAVFLGWILLSRHVYGQAHFTAVAQAKMAWPTLAHAFTLGVFAIGTIPVLVLAPLSWITKRTAPTRDPALLFLTGWSALGLTTLLIAIPWVCARYFVIVAPALILLIVRLVEEFQPVWLHSKNWRTAILLILIGFGLTVAQADLTQACTDEKAARWANQFRQDNAPDAGAYFAAAELGSSGYYLEQLGWKGLQSQEVLPDNSIVFIPRRSLPRQFWPKIDHYVLLVDWNPQMRNPLRVRDGLTGAGFYGSIWAPWPYSWSHESPEQYLILKSQPS